MIPAVSAVLGARSVALCAHDGGVVRTIGVGSTGIWRALDLLAAAPFELLPLGTRSFRAALVGAFVSAIAGYVAFDVARALTAATVPSILKNVGDKKSERLISAVSAVAVVTGLLSPAWQTEAASPAGATTGALLVLLALRATTLPAVAVLAGAAASYEPLALLAVLAAGTPTLVGTVTAPAPKDAPANPASWMHALCMFLIGLAPLAVGAALARRPPEIALIVPAIERTARIGPIGFALDEIGVVFLVTGVAGAALASTRRSALPLFGAVLAGVAALAMHVPSGPNRYEAAVLSGLVVFYMLMANTLAIVVLAIARARVPFAEASAAMIVLIELVLPIRSADEAFSRRDARVAHASAIWNDLAWGSAAPGSILLIHDRATMGRIATARATGDFREDLVVVPAFDVQSRAGEHALLAEPKLAALYRDMALDIPPEELSLSQLGAERPVLANFDPKWDRALARHLVPLGLTARFEPEPRGSSDRTRALEAFSGIKDRLVRIEVARKDPELSAATATLLRARVVGMAATGEREVLSRALDDLRVFAPDDPVANTIVRRMVTTKGSIDVKDLRPYL